MARHAQALGVIGFASVLAREAWLERRFDSVQDLAVSGYESFVTGLLPPVARCSAKRLAFGGRDILELSRRELEDLRGKGIGL